MRHVMQRTDIHQGRIVLFGRSLGGAVALHAVSAFPSVPAAVILENTFTSISDMVDQIFPVFISSLKWLVLRIRWRSIDIIPEVKQPILFISGASGRRMRRPHTKVEEFQYSMSRLQARRTSSFLRGCCSAFMTLQKRVRSGSFLSSLTVLTTILSSGQGTRTSKGFGRFLAEFAEKMRSHRALDPHCPPHCKLHGRRQQEPWRPSATNRRYVTLPSSRQERKRARIECLRACEVAQKTISRFEDRVMDSRYRQRSRWTPSKNRFLRCAQQRNSGLSRLATALWLVALTEY
jgi:pimeloyl-ACP methyl ester carboxylesterase